MPTPATPRPHPSSRGDRSRLLAIAADMAVTSSASHYAVAHVSMGEVARAAGVTRTALYRLWPSRQDLWDELVDHILASPAPRVLPRPGTVTNLALDAAQDILLADPLPLLRTGVVGYPRQGDDRSLLGAQRDETVTSLTAIVETHLGEHRPIGDLTATDLAVIVTIVGNGLPLTARLAGPDAVHVAASPPARRRSLLAVLAGALVGRLTEGRSPRVLDGVVASVTTPAATGPKDAPAGAGRRAHYLSVAADLALRPGPDGLDHVLGHVTLDGLARRAGVTRRTLTNVWPDRTAFRLDLFSHLLARERRCLIDAIAAAAQTGSDPMTAFLSIGDAIEAEVTRALPAASWLAFAPHLDAAPLAERARRDHDVLADEITRAVRRLLSSTGRRPRPAIPLRTLAVAITTLADGTTRLARTRPALLGDGVVVHGARHTLTGCAVGALLDELTEPLDDSGPVVDLARLLA